MTERSEGIENASVLGIGEVLWDMLPSGRRLGGAPLNVTAQLRRMGFTATYLTAVGDDEPGRAALARMRELGVDTSRVRTAPGVPTGRAEVVLDPSGDPTFEIVKPAAYDLLAAGGPVEPPDHAPDVLVYGTLAACRPATFDAISRLTSRYPDALRVYDVNLRPGCWTPRLVDGLARTANVLKVSERELPHLSRSHEGIEEAVRDIAGRYGMRAVACSRGARGGALLFDGVFVQQAPPRVTVVDAVGAGDAFTAAMVDGIHRGLPAAEILRRANALGALVASHSGALPEHAGDALPGAAWPRHP
ncbi:carbohydrate kinase [Actinoallomurus sp. NBC_01490]|jgi:fructokinase|uniref:carbohydrate kinase family protein n=1 Tax=Actinoallomurus sp. NBC_01490 TaxID=2903557 RepID=UPI002E36EAC6|nr:carbohydrate kinase [Actinoallomurus sp. NBC_01490]